MIYLEAVKDRTFKQQFDILGELIKTDLNAPFMLGNQAVTKPADLETELVIYPYYSYNITSYRKVQHITKRFDNSANVQFIYYDQWDISISIAAVGVGIFETMEAARKLHVWFQDVGKRKLSLNSIPVITLGAVAQRDFFMGNQYERRHGFDLVLRMARESEELITYIETVEVQNETQ